MTRLSRTAPLLAAIVVLALAGCAAPATAPGSTPEPQGAAAEVDLLAVPEAEGPLVEEITPDGAVLNFRGSRFKLSND